VHYLHVSFFFLVDLSLNTAHFIYSPSKAKDGDMISVYSTDPIAQNPAVALSVPWMVLIAILSGGDYDKVTSSFLPPSHKSELT